MYNTLRVKGDGSLESLNKNNSDLYKDNFTELFDLYIKTLVHEIKNPLAVLKGNAQLVEAKNLNILDAKQWQQFHSTIDYIVRTLDYYSDYSNFSDFCIDKFTLINLNSLILDVFEFFELYALSESIELNLIEPTYSVDLYGLPDKIKELIINIVKNSIEACKKGDKITLKYSIVGSFATIQVIDTGCGMSECTMEKITQPFYTTKKQGTGIGLTIVNKILKRHNGQLSISSILNQGSTFTISLPLSQA